MQLFLLSLFLVCKSWQELNFETDKSETELPRLARIPGTKKARTQSNVLARARLVTVTVKPKCVV
jgi:hypothetical protein